MQASTPVSAAFTKCLVHAPARTRTTYPKRLLSLLPAELIGEILQYLDQTDLRSVAAVSRLFYASAWRAGLYLHLNIGFLEFKCAPDGFTALKEFVSHMLQKELSLSLTVTLRLKGVGDAACKLRNGRAPSLLPMHATAVNVAHDILALVSSALPILVYLSVSAPDDLFPAVAAALRHPAPTIATFELCVFPMVGGPSAHQAPADLFAGSAPKLRALALEGIPLGRDPVPAFTRVDSVALIHAAVFSDIEYARHFPRLRGLVLSLYCHHREPPHAFHLQGVRLRKLVLTTSCQYSLMPTILRSTRLEEVANVELVCGPADWTDPLWTREHDGPISVCVAYAGGPRVKIIVVPEHLRWRRTFYLCKRDFLAGSFPVRGLPGLAERLAYLRMDSTHVAQLLERHRSCLALPALHDMRVDFNGQVFRRGTTAWLPDWFTADGAFSQNTCSAPLRQDSSDSGHRCVDCSALERLSVFAVHRALRVKSRDVALLGHALSQCARRKEDRASLSLVGVDLAPREHPMLDEVFSDVCRHAFVGEPTSARGRDEGMWEDNFDL